jgi:hypothetical protein
VKLWLTTSNWLKLVLYIGMRGNALWSSGRIAMREIPKVGIGIFLSYIKIPLMIAKLASLV